MRTPLTLCLAIAVGAGLAVACDTVDTGATPADVNACRPSKAFFLDEIWPNFLSKDYGGQTCGSVACHNQGSGRQLILVTPTSAPGLPLPPDWEAAWKSASEQMLCTNAAASPLFARPAGLQTHGGGRLIDPAGPEAALIQAWVTAP